MNLSEFLLARVEEDEATARAAAVASAAWHLDDLNETVLWWPPEPPARIARTRELMGDDQADADAQWRGQTIESAGDRFAPHIARWDPTRVLAECEAKRRIVEEHAPSGQRAPVCDTCADRSFLAAGDSGGAPWPCPTLRILVLPYAGHDLFQEEWAL